MDNDTHIIDAAGKRLGRVASEAAAELAGKRNPGYRPNAVTGKHVEVQNAAALDIKERKLLGKIYTRYSGWPGGLKEERLEEVIASKGASEALRRAIYGMLPSNKLRAQMMKRLTINE